MSWVSFVLWKIDAVATAYPDALNSLFIPSIFTTKTQDMMSLLQEVFFNYPRPRRLLLRWSLLFSIRQLYPLP